MQSDERQLDWTPADLGMVTHLLAETARREAMPFWRNLADEDVDWKSQHDPVTVADRNVENALAACLPAIRHGRFVGEETVHADPASAKALRDDGAVWIVDPIDGTTPFAKGEEGWGVMAAFMDGGEVRAAWLHDPLSGETLAGSGGLAWVFGPRAAGFSGGAGRRFSIPPNPPARGSVLDDRGTSRATLAIRETAAEQGYELCDCPPSVLGAVAKITRGELAFAAFQGAKPWDFLPVAGALRAAGGTVSPTAPTDWLLDGKGAALVLAAKEEAIRNVQPKAAAA